MVETFEARIAALMPHAQVLRPDGAVPFPVVIQMHGCGGVKPFQTTWAEVARAAGWAAIVLDSYAHRGISRSAAYATVCTGARLWGRERAGDLFAALAWVRRQPWADGTRVVAAGWSHGGWTVLDALALRPGADAAIATKLADLPEEPLAGLAGAFLVYPWAGMGCLAARRGLRFDARPRVLIGSRDSVAGGMSLYATLSRMRAPSPLDLRWLDATHAFDEPEATDFRVRHDPVAVAQAHALLRDYLRGI